MNENDNEETEDIYVKLRTKLVGVLNDEFIHGLSYDYGDRERRDAEVRLNPGVAIYLADHAWSCLPYQRVPSHYPKGDVDIFIQPDLVESQCIRYFETIFGSRVCECIK